MSITTDILQRGARSSQAAATAVVVGALYCVTDENDKVEQSNGSSWVGYSPTVASATLGGDITGTAGTATVVKIQNKTFPSTVAIGDIFAVSATNAIVSVTGNVSTTKQFLTSTGTGTQAVLPAWGGVIEGDLPVPARSSLTSATNITWDVGSTRDALANVTLSLAAVTLTLTNVVVGVAGMLRVTAGVTNPSLTLPAGSLQVGGGATAAALSTGTVGVVDLLGFVCISTGAYIWSVGKGVA